VSDVDLSPADQAARTALARAAAGELLGPADIAAIWRIGHSQFNRLNRAHAFDAFKVKPAIGRMCFSGTLVYRHVNGEPMYEPSFGRKRGTR
jgi:hypothetical protein